MSFGNYARIKCYGTKIGTVSYKYDYIYIYESTNHKSGGSIDILCNNLIIGSLEINEIFFFVTIE